MSDKRKGNRCPKCGKGMRRCKCPKINYWAMGIGIGIVLIISAIIGLNLVHLDYVRAANPDEEKIFSNVLNSLPDEKVQAEYNSLIDNDKIRVYLNTKKMPGAAMYDPDNKALNIDVNHFQTEFQEDLWCVLVHELVHINRTKNISPSGDKNAEFDLEKKAREVFTEEYPAILAEAAFAKKNNFLRKVQPELCRIMDESGMDLETGTVLATFQYLMNSEIPMHQPLKPFFPKILYENLDPKYWDNIEFKSL